MTKTQFENNERILFILDMNFKQQTLATSINISIHVHIQMRKNIILVLLLLSV